MQEDVNPGEQLTTALFSRLPAINVCPCPVGDVLVAIERIPKGTPGRVIRTRAGYYKVTSIRRARLLRGAIVDPATLVGKVTVRNVPAGSQLTSADFRPSRR